MMPKANARRGIALATLVATMFGSGVALAGPEDRECALSAERAQVTRDEGKFRRAREMFLFCARDVCPSFVKKDCTEWLGKLDRDAPTVVLAARDGKGADIVDAKVSMDGVPLIDRLDGNPIVVDSGEHTFKFETKDGGVKEERVLILVGAKARPIIATFGAPPAADANKGKDPGGKSAASASSDGVVAPLIVGGIGVVALASFAIFAIGGTSDVDDLKATCGPTRTCAEKDVESARTKLIIGDISLGIGVVALGVAAYMYFTRPAEQATLKARRERERETRLRFAAGPVTGGAIAGVGAAF
jgi:hypothetical protein